MSNAPKEQQIAEITRLGGNVPPAEFRLILKLANLVAAGSILADHIRESHANADSKIPRGLAAAMEAFNL